MVGVKEWVLGARIGPNRDWREMGVLCWDLEDLAPDVQVHHHLRTRSASTLPGTDPPTCTPGSPRGSFPVSAVRVVPRTHRPTGLTPQVWLEGREGG